MLGILLGFFCIFFQQVFCCFSTGDEDSEAGKVIGKKNEPEMNKDEQ